MQGKTLSEQDVHFFSQLIYLDAFPQMGKGDVVTVGDLADYYLDSQPGQAHMQIRFGHTPKEYVRWLAFLREDAVPYRNWQITDVFDDNAPRQTGFYGASYINDETRVVAFRGSELLGNPLYRNDYETNMALAYACPTPQQERVAEYWQLYPMPQQQLYITGHSLGGNLAIYGGMVLPEELLPKLVGVYAFNAPGFCDDCIKQYKKRLKQLDGRIFLYQNRYDLISSLLGDVTEPLIIASRFEPDSIPEPTVGDILAPHSNFLFLQEEDGSFVRDTEKTKCKLCRYAHRLTDLVQLLPVDTRQELGDAILRCLYKETDSKALVNSVWECLSQYISKKSVFSSSANVGTAALVLGGKLLGQRQGISQLYHAVTSAAAGEPDFAALAHTVPILVEAFAAVALRPNRQKTA